jgi:hypothetical protein
LVSNRSANVSVAFGSTTELPDADPHVRWCGWGGLTSPPTRLANTLRECGFRRGSLGAHELSGGWPGLNGWKPKKGPYVLGKEPDE